ncbi:MAG: cysteine desulfurase family protein [Cyanobacteria bacterium]|nr:cysteine desulfurase family protein [Cyanobacteriota bacterium]
MQIYLDYSATTPTRSEVVNLMQTVMAQEWGNPSSLHVWGNRSATLLEQARTRVGNLIHAPAETIVFTSGGTEANNLAIFGITQQFSTPQHLIISNVEHSAISEPARYLEARGWQVTRLPVDAWGLVSAVDLVRSIQPNTVLISIIWGQSEIGTIQPIARLAEIARSYNILFHTDAVQVAGRLPIDVSALPIDLLSLSSHKLYGPQGCGALYIRSGVTVLPILLGGGQESGERSGTQAVPTIAGFGLAAELIAAEMAAETVRLTELRDRLFEQLLGTALKPTGSPTDRLPHHASFCLPDADGFQQNGKTLVRQMNLAGIGISAGAACSSGKLEPSLILRAIGHDDRIAKTGIRLTFGRGTTTADVEWTAVVLRQILNRMGL